MEVEGVFGKNRLARPTRVQDGVHVPIKIHSFTDLEGMDSAILLPDHGRDSGPFVSSRMEIKTTFRLLPR